jgi:D-alanine-D-alanine ligase
VKRRFERVCVLKGGVSAERDVSLRSGAAIAQGLRARGYAVIEMDLVTADDVPLPEGVDVVFIALHGAFGEDGGVQRILRERRIPFTGSSAESCRAAFDKTESRRRFEQAGVPVPPGLTLYAPTQAPPLPLPIFVKPARQGSSIGSQAVREVSEWPSAFAKAAQYGGDVIVEKWIEGRELTVGIVNGEALPIVEIRAPGGFYDYGAKYTPGASEYLIPAPLPATLASAVQACARRVFETMDAAGFGRVDFRLAQDGRWYALELNSIPGFTETSLLPKAAAAAGIPFPELCERILNSADIR